MRTKCGLQGWNRNNPKRPTLNAKHAVMSNNTQKIPHIFGLKIDEIPNLRWMVEAENGEFQNPKSGANSRSFFIHSAWIPPLWE